MNITRIKEPKISHETAKLAHEAGFDKIHISGFVEWLDDQGNISDTAHELDMMAGKFVTKYKIVNQALLQQWIREDLKIEIEIEKFTNKYRVGSSIFKDFWIYTGFINEFQEFETYSEALEEVLNKSIQYYLKSK